ncbi:UbiX family flavin prenyltransferase [Alkalicoccobacillus murimartini]|uniref:Flavin prenyltransferase UbiX n=1 Tax=Alkalicoccobacillus murimartini TaxID=171685 RepID=A0ABT9YDW5_9BACI|nr:flavin prenyltransferase UbiX [Alkalicoccobacillus murimartini]MDQ0205914.1 4-hydroxy-3-polyprenylbenzoate decarboxylase [Alkalicoccobacillus murimartini]
MSTQYPYIVGITGASGAVYGIRLVQELLRAKHEVHLVLTEAAWQVFKAEMNLDTTDREALLDSLFKDRRQALHIHDLHNYAAPIASGSFRTEGMIVIPCSMGSLSGMAAGASGNLIERAADVMLKEHRKLVIVPRETPLHQIQLENMLKLSKAGAIILPAMPGFYHSPQSLDDLILFVVGKALDSLGVDHELFKRWGTES